MSTIKKNYMEGKHLAIDGWCAPNKKNTLSNRGYISNLLETIADNLKIRMLMPPSVIQMRLSAKDHHSMKEGGGVTGFAILQGGHVCIHTWPFQNKIAFEFFFVDDFNSYVILNVLQKQLELTGSTVQMTLRGWDEDKVNETWTNYSELSGILSE